MGQVVHIRDSLGAVRQELAGMSIEESKQKHPSSFGQRQREKRKAAKKHKGGDRLTAA